MICCILHNLQWQPLIRFAVALASLTAPREPQMTVAEQSPHPNLLRMKDQLDAFCGSLQNYAASKCEKDYVADLRTSCAALDNHSSSNEVNGLCAENAQDLLQDYRDDCERYFDKINQALVQCITASSSPADQIGLCTLQSSRLSPSFWLEQLHRDRFFLLPEWWRAVIIEYGLAITQLHRAQRLIALSNKPVDLAEELGHIGHSNWNPHEFPETLLLEAESGIMVRKEQALIASHMLSPQHGNNAVLQLQMGQGKSTVLTPVVAAALTDKKK